MGKIENMNIEPSFETIRKLSKIIEDFFGSDSVRTILEFGSRYGEDTVVFATKYPKAMVYAFECNPNTVAACRENVRPYKNILLIEKAVSDSDGIVSFYKINKDKTQTTWLDGNQGASSLLKSSGKYPVETYVQDEVKVASVTLFTFMKEKNISTVDILWMDIQGAELLALKGLSESIKKVKVIHLEVEFFEIYKNQPLFDEISSFLKEHNFDFFGFTYQSKYSGDAIFINKHYIPLFKIRRYKIALRLKEFFTQVSIE